jgi:hypothetical protein
MKKIFLIYFSDYAIVSRGGFNEEVLSMDAFDFVYILAVICVFKGISFLHR